MDVFRVENGQGHGPYTFVAETDAEQFVRQKMSERHNDSPEHPAWARDFNDIWGRPEMVSGFDSMESLRSWFGEWLGPLEKAGFSIVKYEGVKLLEYSLSGRQLRFVKPI